VARKEEGGPRAQRITSVGVRRTCVVARRPPSKGASVACGGKEGKSRRETGMPAAARAARGAIGGHSPALQIVQQSRLRSTQLQRLHDRLAEALESRRGLVRWKKEEGRRRAQRITSVGVRRACGIALRQPSKGASAACGGEVGESRRETGMAAAASAPKGAIGDEHSEQARAPHTNGPRDVPRCGALSSSSKDAKRLDFILWGSEFTSKAAKRPDLIQTQVAQRRMQRVEVYARALRLSQHVK
jgi:hypothetical protein